MGSGVARHAPARDGGQLAGPSGHGKTGGQRKENKKPEKQKTGHEGAGAQGFDIKEVRKFGVAEEAGLAEKRNFEEADRKAQVEAERKEFELAEKRRFEEAEAKRKEIEFEDVRKIEQAVTDMMQHGFGINGWRVKELIAKVDQQNLLGRQ